MVRNLMVRAGADFSSMRKEMQKAQQSVQNFKKATMKALKFIVSAYAVKKMADFGRSAVRSYNEAAVASAKLERVMRNTMNATDEQIKGIKALAAAQQGLGVIHADIQIAGAQELGTYLSEANSLKTLLPTLNNMLAQQYGLDATAENAVQIGTMIGKVMDGQLGALSRYGYSWTEAQEHMLKFGTEAQRAATLAEVVNQSVGGMNEALARTPQGQIKQLAMTFSDVKAELGRGILPILQKILPYIQSVANAFLRVAQFVSAFTSALFGSGQTDTSNTLAQAGAISDLGDAYEEAGKQAKGAVSGFDQINLVGGSTGGEELGGIGGAIGALDDNPFEGLEESMSDVAKKAQEMAARVKSAFGSMKDFIVQNKEIIIAALAGIGTAFATYLVVSNWTNITTAIRGVGVAISALLSPIGLAIAAVGALVAAAVYFYQTNETFREVVQTIWQGIANTITWLWQNVMVPFGEWLGSVFVAIWGAVSDAASWLWNNILAPFGEFLMWILDNVLIPIAEVLVDVLGVAFQTVADIAKSFWENVLVPLGQALSEMLEPAIEAVSAVLTFLWQKAFKPFGEYLANILKPILKSISDSFTFMWQKALKPLADFVSGTLKQVFSDAFKSIGGVITGIKTVFVGLMHFITGVFTGNWKKAWEGVKEIFKGVFDSLYNIVKFPLNLIIDAINAVIKGLNKLSIDVPDWVPGFGGDTWGVNIPTIPRLAKGGLAYGPTLAMVGDNRGASVDPEVIAPLSKLEAIIGKDDNREVVSVLKAILQAVKSSGNSDTATISKTDLGRAASSALNDISRRTGKLPIRA